MNPDLPYAPAKPTPRAKARRKANRATRALAQGALEGAREMLMFAAKHLDDGHNAKAHRLLLGCVTQLDDVADEIARSNRVDARVAS